MTALPVKPSASVPSRPVWRPIEVANGGRRGVFVVNLVQRIAQRAGETAQRFGEADEIVVARLQQAFDLAAQQEGSRLACVPSCSLILMTPCVA